MTTPLTETTGVSPLGNWIDGRCSYGGDVHESIDPSPARSSVSSARRATLRDRRRSRAARGEGSGARSGSQPVLGSAIMVTVDPEDGPGSGASR